MTWYFLNNQSRNYGLGSCFTKGIKLGLFYEGPLTLVRKRELSGVIKWNSWRWMCLWSCLWCINSLTSKTIGKRKSSEVISIGVQVTCITDQRHSKWQGLATSCALLLSHLFKEKKKLLKNSWQPCSAIDSAQNIHPPPPLGDCDCYMCAILDHVLPT